MIWIESKIVVSLFILSMNLVVAQWLSLLGVAHSITRVLNGFEHQPENSNAIEFISLANLESITVDFLNFITFSLKEKNTYWVVDV